MSFDGSLAAWLREQHGLLSLQQAVHIVRKTSDALQQLHNKQIVYYSMNPSNVLIHADGENTEYFDVRLANVDTGTPGFTSFGRSYPANSLLMYMAPEQWTGQALPATDQYALAVIAYELLAGQPPFQGPPAQLMDSHMRVQPLAPSTLNRRVSPAVDAVILSALSKRPEDRFPSISAFARALEQAVLRPEPLTASIPGMPVDGDLRATLLINKAEMATGAMRTITLPQGRRITVAVPGGVYNGQVIRLEGFGDPSSTGGASGALFLTIAVNQAQPDISPPASSRETRVLPVPVSSTITNSKAIASRAYSTVTHLSSGRKIALLATVVLLLVFLSVGLFPLLQKSASVAMPYPPDSGSLAVNDLLHDNSGGNNWPATASPDGSACQFVQGTYHVSMTHVGSFHYCIAGSTEFSNFAYEVRMTISQGDEGGVIFRADGNQGKFYYFRIDRDGSYGLYLFVDTVGTHARTLVSGVTPVIHTGLNVSNLLAVVARNGTLDLYVNDQRVASVHDSTYGSGQIGVAAASITGPTEVAFSDARLWTV